jgi:hypothetical protein
MHSRALLAGDHQPRPAQHRQLLRQVRRLDPDLRQHLGHRVLALAEQLKYADPSRVRQRLEELGFQLVERLAHLDRLSVDPPPQHAAAADQRLRTLATLQRSHRAPAPEIHRRRSLR